MVSFQKKYVAVSWGVTIIIAIFIFYMSSRTFPSGGGKGYLSYVYHFTVFFALALFLLLASLKGRFNKEIFILAIILSIVYGIIDELHQYFVPGRYADIHDVFMNAAGILLAGILYSLTLFRRNKTT